MERLQAKRTVSRAELLRLSEEVSALSTTEDLDPHLEDRIAEIRDELDALAKEIKQQDALIEPHVRDNAIAEEYGGVRKHQALITRTRTRLERLQRKNTTVGGTDNASTTAASAANGAGHVKLPKLELQKFSGDKLGWQPFWEHFRLAVHENSTLSDTEKFLYLRAALTGKAAAAVSGIQGTEQNYEYAVKTLKERFGRQDVLVQEHLTQLLSLQHVKSLDDVSALRRLHDHVQRNIAGLTTLGVPPDSYSAMLCAALFRVLPTKWAVAYHKAHAADEDVIDSSTLNAVLSSLRLELESRERANAGSEQVPPKPSRGHQPRDKHSDYAKGKGSAASLKVGAHYVKSRCPLCDSERHEAAECNATIPMEEKKSKLRREGRCYRCAKKGHMTRECKNWSLRCAKCGRRHITPLCDPPAPPADEKTATELHSTTSLNNSTKNTVLLQTAQVWVDGPCQKRLARCLFDGGSQRSFVTEHVARELNLEVIGEEEVTIYPFGGLENVMKRKRRLIRVWLRSQYSRKEHCIEALEVEEICADRLVLPDNVAHLAGTEDLELADVTLAPARNDNWDIEVLIGADSYWSIVNGEVRNLQGSLVAVNTDFGWTLQGPIPQVASTVCCSTVVVLRVGAVDPAPGLSSELRAFWELESLGISSKECQVEDEGAQVRQDFTRSLNFVDGRYEASLPWKPLDRPLESNESVARQRLDKLVQRLRRNKKLTQYDTVIRNYLEEGFAERVPETEVNDTSDRVYYMPHRAVFRPDSTTTKVRIVFDASAKAPGCLSLNDTLSTGPNLHPDLLQLILNFRRHAIAITADIEKAFLQVVIKEEDRNALRFLWYASPPERDSTSAQIEVWRMTRVPFGATSSPFMLAATIKHHLTRVSEGLTDTAKVLEECLYVDDLITGADTEERAASLYKEARLILDSAGMKLRKWSTNSDLLLQQFNRDGLGNPSRETSTTTTAVTRVLGLEWDRESDELKYSLGAVLELLTTNRNTKRFVLQASARIFDPLGLLGPVTITVKMLLQELWTLGLDWDSPLPPDVSVRWDRWIDALPHLREISIPRRYVLVGEATELHIFTDASPQAYGAVAYARSDDGDQTTVTLIMAKTRVAPIKTLTLPRLELMGTLLGARMCSYLKQAMSLSFSTVTLWTDSMIALHWVRGPAAQWKPFVANRVMEVQEKTEPSDWRHCPGIANPADLLTRGVAPDALKGCDKWWKGPMWLSQLPRTWPVTPSSIPGPSSDEERKSSAQVVGHVTSDSLQSVIPIERFSEMNRLLRVTAWLRRFISNCQRKVGTRRGPLNAEEIQEARLLLLRQVQREAFGKELSHLEHGKHFSESSELRSLNAFLDDEGLLRLKGRLQFSDLSYEAAHPVLLPATHHFVELLIKNTHRRLLHAGCLDTMTQLRENFWIVRARQAVKKVLNRCFVCKKMNSKPATEPVAPLPRDRISEAAPFSVVGLDFAGPVLTKTEGKVQKSYILLITCAVTRAVHLEAVTDLSTGSFLLAFRRFVARRGLCRTIYSDNAKTFHRAAGELKRLWRAARDQEMLNYLAQQGIEWKFIVERAAWWGGFWERMVRSTKAPLKKVLGCSYVTFEELCTILADIEAVINSRPLTFLSSDVNEPEPLTPAHFLIGRRLTSLPSHGEQPTASTRNELTRRWKYRERLSGSLWKRWRTEYLCALRSYHHAAPSDSSDLRIGDFVLLHEDFRPRQTWKVGRITEVFPGRDGHIRSCAIRLPGGTVVRRPVQLLHPLEAKGQ